MRCILIISITFSLFITQKVRSVLPTGKEDVAISGYKVTPSKGHTAGEFTVIRVGGEQISGNFAEGSGSAGGGAAETEKQWCEKPERFTAEQKNEEEVVMKNNDSGEKTGKQLSSSFSSSSSFLLSSPSTNQKDHSHHTECVQKSTSFTSFLSTILAGSGEGREKPSVKK